MTEGAVTTAAASGPRAIKAAAPSRLTRAGPISSPIATWVTAEAAAMAAAVVATAAVATETMDMVAETIVRFQFFGQ